MPNTCSEAVSAAGGSGCGLTATRPTTSAGEDADAVLVAAEITTATQGLGGCRPLSSGGKVISVEPSTVGGSPISTNSSCKAIGLESAGARLTAQSSAFSPGHTTTGAVAQPSCGCGTGCAVARAAIPR